MEKLVCFNVGLCNPYLSICFSFFILSAIYFSESSFFLWLIHLTTVPMSKSNFKYFVFIDIFKQCCCKDQWSCCQAGSNCWKFCTSERWRDQHFQLISELSGPYVLVGIMNQPKSVANCVFFFVCVWKMCSLLTVGIVLSIFFFPWTPVYQNQK